MSNHLLKIRFRSLISNLLDTARSNDEDRKSGMNPTVRARSIVLAIEDVRQCDKVLATKIENVEVAQKELDDYILSRKETIERMKAEEG